MHRDRSQTQSSGGNPERSRGLLEKLFDSNNTAPVIIRDMDGEHDWDESWRRISEFSPLLKRSRDYQGDRRLEFMHKDEADFMAGLLLEPSRDLATILERQAAIKALSVSSDLDELINLRTQAYNAHAGAWDLLCYYGTNPFYYKGSEERLISVYQRGVTELPDYEESGFGSEGVLDVESLVEEGVSKIEVGLIGFENFARVLSKVPHRSFAKIVEEAAYVITDAKQRFNRESVRGESKYAVIDDLEEDDWRTRIYDDGYGYLDRFADKRLKPALLRLGSLVEFADIVRKNHWSPVTFDPTEPDFYIGGWNLERPRGKQVINNSPDDKLTVIYSGANTSGKSFGMKMDFLIRLAAQATGFAPVEGGNLRLNQVFAFLDRASSQHEQDLSAFMSEVQNWNKVLPNLGINTRLYVDEGFSTTSPDDQARLLLAISRYINKQGGSMVLASHNENLIRRSISNGNVGIYHYRSDVAPDGKLARHFTLTPGPDDSKAIAVARARNFHPDMNSAAEKYLSGDYVFPNTERTICFPEITSYTEEERERMKLEQKSLDNLIPDNPVNPLFQLYSLDDDFKPSYFLRQQNSTVDKNGELRSKFARMILFAGILSSSQILERQKMFSELLLNKKFMNIHGDIGVLRVADFSISIIANSQAEGINKALYPLAIDPRREPGQEIELQARDIKALVAFLSLNAKILGDKFNYSELLERLKGVKGVKNPHELLDELEAVHKALPVIRFEDISLEAIADELDVLLAHKNTSEKGNLLQRKMEQNRDINDDMVELLTSVIGGLPLALKEYPYYQIAVEELVGLLKSTDSVYLYQSANLVDTLFTNMVNQVLSKQKAKTDADLLTEKDLSSFSMLGRGKDSPLLALLSSRTSESPFAKELSLLDALCSGASIIDSQGFAPVVFNATGKVQIVNGFNLLKAKGEQIANSTVLGEDNSKLHVLTGPNGSGKTFYEKGAVAAILTGLATGYMPAESATLPIFDSVVYLDRVTEKVETDLSAFTNELVFWDELIGNLRNKNAVFAAADEAFSTTSPLYQSAFTYAAVGEFRKYGHYLMLSTHNHEVVDKLSISGNGPVVEPYYFSFKMSDGKVSFDYQIQKGHQTSHAVEVAKTLGFKEEIVNLALSI